MIVALIILLGLLSLTVVIAGLLVQRANQRADDADARRFKALELLNEEQDAREQDQRLHRARLHAIETTCLETVGLYRRVFDQLTGADADDEAVPPRVM